MPPKKKNPAEWTDAPAPKTPALIVPKTSIAWDALLKKAASDRWRRIQVTIKLREKLYGGKPRFLDAAKAMIAARGLEDTLEALPENPEERAALAEQAAQEGINEFHRRPGKDGIWFPTNNIKAHLKENWSVLGYRKEYVGSRVSLAEAVFVYSIQPEGTPNVERDYIYLGKEADGIDTTVCHSDIRGQKVASIKRNEYLLAPTISFEICIAKEVAPKVPDEAWAAVFLHGCEHGLGASRSQGFGKFDIVEVKDVGTTADVPGLTSVA